MILFGVSHELPSDTWRSAGLQPAPGNQTEMVRHGYRGGLKIRAPTTESTYKNHTPNLLTPPHHRTTAPPHHRTTAPLHHCTTAPLHHCTTAPLHHGANMRLTINLDERSLRDGAQPRDSYEDFHQQGGGVAVAAEYFGKTCKYVLPSECASRVRVSGFGF